MGSAIAQGQLWGALARDWAAYGEQICLPLQGAALDAAHVTAGTRLLDAGCGAGLLALLASLRGAQVAAFDAAATLLAIVRKRVPSADVREGDLEALPFADASFDEVACLVVFPSAEISWRAHRSAGPNQLAIAHSGEAAVRTAFAEVDRTHTRPDGTIRYENVFLWAAGKRM